MKKIVLIQSHCPNLEKKEFLKSNILKLKSLGLDVLLFSHIALPEDVIELTDYFIYDKSNPIMWEERRGIYWKDFNGVKLTVGVPEYGWTVFNQVIKSSQLALSQDYEYFYLMCYDTIIGDTVINSINNPSSCITFKHYKNENFLSNATLIFSCFNKSNLSQLISLFNREEYAKNYHLVAEDYLEEKLSLLKTCTFSKFQVTDQFHESTDIFNLNLYNDKFKIFISNEGELKSLVYDVQEEFILIVNNQAYNINPNVFEVLDLSNHNIINNLGFFIEGEYYNLLPSYNKLTTKVIENIWLPQ